MKYLQKWSLFRESNGDDPPEGDGDFSGIGWDSTPAEIPIQKENDQEQTQKAEPTPTEKDGKVSEIREKDPKQKIWFSENFVKDVLDMDKSIEDAFDPESEKYYFHHHAKSAWWIFAHDDIKGAKKSFFGDDIEDTTSWWYKNITSVISKNIELNTNPKRIVDNINSCTQYISNNLNTVTDKKKKAALKVCLDLLGEDIYGKITKAFDRSFSSDKFYYVDMTIGFEISIDTDFGLADNEKAKTGGGGYDISINRTEDIVKYLDHLTAEVNKLDNKNLFLVLAGILDLVDKIFKCEEVWKPHKGWNDNDREAAKFLETDIFEPISKDVIDPYIKKLEGLNINQTDKQHYKKEAERIRDNFFSAILSKMRGFAYDIVEFRIQGWNKKDQKTVRIDVDF